ncbi:MAG: hypothetical protein AAGK17_03640 [Pseudomonadota bacterium]
MSQIKKYALTSGSAVAALCLASTNATAQDVSLNYDRLSSLEEPIAFDLGEVTVEITGVADAPLIVELDNLNDTDSVDGGFVGNFQISAQTQLGNRWTLGAAYFGQYATGGIEAFSGGDDYTDNVAAFVGTSFGTVLGGNVNGQVREVTRRQRGVGNGFLAFDDFYGGLDEWGGAYVGRFGPSVLSAAVDENGDFEVGAVFQRPIGEKDYRFSVRAANARFTSQDGTTEFDTKGISGVAEFVYGSSIFDLGAGYERLDSSVVDIDRWYLSAGAQTQTGPWQFSAEGHYGQAAGDDEFSVGLGASYDIARGLSANLGVNYQNADVNAGGVTLIETDEVTAIASLRFSF